MSSIPGALLEKVNKTCLEVYKVRSDLIDKGRCIIIV